jgi:hypothetical protein
MERQLAQQMQDLYDEDLARRGGVPRSQTAPGRPSLLNVGGIGERLAFLNQTFNPVEGIGGAMRAGERLFSQDADYLQRIEALGSMLSGVAGIAAPIAAARAIGVPAASAMMEGLLGGSPTTQAAGDMARQFAVDESGAFRLYQGSPHNFNAERLVRYPDGRTEYIVGRPDVLPDVPAGAEVLQDFPLGRQRMDKIGTGEGAQAYGYGLYGAEAEGIARGYRDALTTPVDYRGGGYPSADTDLAAKKVADAMGPNSDPANVIASEANKYRYQAQQMRAKIDNQPTAVREANERLAASFERIADDIEKLNPDDFQLNSGRMYELNINANPEDFLDWDKPLSEQPNVLSRLGYSIMDEDAIHAEATRIMEAMPGGAWMNDPASKARIDELQAMLDRKAPSGTGQDFYRGGSSDDVTGILSQMGYGDPAARSQELREAGIPGIRYLDAGSRGAGDGSRNYVIFDENLIEIVRKYGIAGAAAMLGVSAVDVEEAIAQGAPPSQWDQLVVGPQ